MQTAQQLVRIDAGVVAYPVACAWQKELHARRVAGAIPDVLLTLQHPHVYTLGRRTRPRHLLSGEDGLRRTGAEVHEADRGGSVTYHGPGQLVVYPMVDLRPPAGGLPDPIGYLRLLERSVIEVLGVLGIEAAARAGLTGVWVGERKIASIGVNVSRGVAKHGLALNVSPDLGYFDMIVPCGIDGCRVTSIERELGWRPELEQVGRLIAGALARRLERSLVSASLADLDLSPSELPTRVPGSGHPARIGA